jgi:hypothetical protein
LPLVVSPADRKSSLFPSAGIAACVAQEKRPQTTALVTWDASGQELLPDLIPIRRSEISACDLAYAHDFGVAEAPAAGATPASEADTVIPSYDEASARLQERLQQHIARLHVQLAEVRPSGRLLGTWAERTAVRTR